MLCRRVWISFALVLLSGCSSLPAPSPSVVATSVPVVSPANSRPDLRPVKRQSKDALTYAQEPLLQTEFRLAQLSRDPEFNGYQDLVEVSRAKGGLLELHALREKKGEAPFNRELAKRIGLESSPLIDDVSTIKRALRKPTLSAPLDVPKSGLVQVPHDQGFQATLKALTILPSIYAQFPERGDQIGGYLFALQVGRKISLQASTLEHYLAGIEVQDLALARLRTLLTGHKLSADEAKSLFIRLQMEVGSFQELLPVLDAEYLMATRVLESKNFGTQKLRKEKLGLAARYLKMRPYFTEAKPPASGFHFQDEVPELVGCEWASQQPDFLQALGRSRKSATQLAAVELLAALEVHKLEQGSYPEKLEELMPAYLTRIPADSLSQSQKFHYERQDESFQLSSQAPNSKPVDW